MKHFFVFLFALSVAFGEPYNANPVPTLNDTQADSLKKINKILNDSRTGDNSLATSGGGGGGSATTDVIKLGGVSIATNTGTASAGTMRVVIATDQPAFTTAVPISVATVPSHAVTNAGTFATQAAQSGTWTVQPGNTANTTAWKVDGSGVTQPVSIATVPSHAVTNAGTFAVQVTSAPSTAVTNAGTFAVQSTEVTGASAGASTVSSTAYEASHVLKASAGTLISLVGYNSKASAQFIQIYNSATVPADTAVPIYTFTVPATSNFSIDVPITGIPFTTGISVSDSSTGPTKTIGSADVFFSAVIK